MSTANPRPLTVLVVSPDRQLLRRLSKFLELVGCAVRQATSQQQALAAADCDSPDFLIADRRAGGSESQLCAAVRRLAPEHRVYALLLAEHLEPNDVTAALESGFDDFLTEPVVFGELLARLRAGARVLEFERRLAGQVGGDSLVGLLGEAALASEISDRSQNSKSPAGWLAVVEVDHFTGITNQLSRQAARDLRHQVARQILASAGGTLVARLPSDQFAVVLDPSPTAEAVELLDSLIAGVATVEVAASEGAIQLTASGGLTEIRPHATLADILPRAAAALALAQASGGACVATEDDVERESEDWAAFAADGKLFDTTLARDVMLPCPVILQQDESVEQAHALLKQSTLPVAPVVDANLRLTGIVALADLAAARSHNPRPKTPGTSSSSVRLVRHIMNKDVTTFPENASLGELMDFFACESEAVAMVVRDDQPRGLVSCQGLASLNGLLTPDTFAPVTPASGTSADLIVPDFALAD